MEILDLKKRYSALYGPKSSVPVLVEVPPLRFPMLDGIGGVGEPDFQLSMSALFGLAYPVKFSAKKRLGISYPVMPAEGLYWDADDGPGSAPASLESTAWRLMIMLPDQVDSEFVDEVRVKVAAKKDLPRLGDIRVQTFSEGASVQALHVGPYAEETPTVDRLLAFARERGVEVFGSHHEIYLSDPNRTKSEKLKTVLRYPVRKIS
jgi:hypothetical protein